MPSVGKIKEMVRKVLVTAFPDYGGAGFPY